MEHSPWKSTDAAVAESAAETEQLTESEAKLEKSVTDLLNCIGSGQQDAHYTGLLERTAIGHTEYVEYDAAHGVRATLYPADTFEGTTGKRGHLTSSKEHK